MWFPLAWNMWREKNFHWAFCLCVPVGIFELTLFLIHENLYNAPVAHLAIGCVSVYLIGANLQVIILKTQQKVNPKVNP